MDNQGESIIANRKARIAYAMVGGTFFLLFSDSSSACPIKKRSNPTPRRLLPLLFGTISLLPAQIHYFAIETLFPPLKILIFTEATLFWCVVSFSSFLGLSVVLT